MVTQEIDPRGRIAAATTPDEVIEALRAFGLVEVAERLAYLRSLEDDLAEDEEPMQMESLRALALLLIEHPELPKPGIGVCDDGWVQIEWNIVPEGLLAMVFRPPGLVDFAVAGGLPDPMSDRASGSGTRDEALAALAPFLDHLAPR